MASPALRCDHRLHRKCARRCQAGAPGLPGLCRPLAGQRRRIGASLRRAGSGGGMAISVNEASAVLREAVRDTVRKRSLLFLIQGGVTVAAGVLALVFPAFASTGVLTMLGWLLILSGAVQVVSLI